MTTYNKKIMYHKERTATVVSPRLSLAAQAGGLPTQPQTDSLDEARVPRRGMHAVLECCPRRAAQESHWTRVQPEIRGAGCIVRL